MKKRWGVKTFYKQFLSFLTSFILLSPLHFITYSILFYYVLYYCTLLHDTVWYRITFYYTVLYRVRYRPSSRWMAMLSTDEFLGIDVSQKWVSRVYFLSFPATLASLPFPPTILSFILFYSLIILSPLLFISQFIIV